MVTIIYKFYDLIFHFNAAKWPHGCNLVRIKKGYILRLVFHFLC